MGTRFAKLVIVLVVGSALSGSGCRKTEDTPKEPAAPTTSPVSKVAETPSVKVGAIFAVTGPASFLGAPEARTAEMLVAQLNDAGGVNGRKIELIVRDSGAKPENAISLAKQLIDEEKVLAIIGPSTSGETMAIKNICQEGNTILLSCAAAEDIVNPVASYVFKTPQKDSDAARWIFKAMKEKGIIKVGVLTSNDGFGMAGKAQLAKIAPEYGITIAIAESYDKQETDLTGILAKLKGQQVEAVINWSIVPAQSLVAKNLKQINLDVPLYQSHGFGNIKYVQAAGESANGTMFPCGRLLVAEALPNDHPQKAILTQYKKDYEDRYKEDVSSFGGYAYDALLILTEAIQKADSLDHEKVREAIENIRGLVGTSGVFNFSAKDHNGLALDAFEMLTVKDGKFAIYGK